MRFIGLNTIYGDEDGQRTPYMTRAWIGRLRLHIFHRGDTDPDYHDHPWDFWTFPLTPYVEAVVDQDIAALAQGGGFSPAFKPDAPVAWRRVVPAFQLHYRPATFCHRVIGRWNGDGRGHSNAYPSADGRKIITIVWRGRSGRRWGFLKFRDGRFCWVHWKEYVFRGGKTAPCDDSQEGI